MTDNVVITPKRCASKRCGRTLHKKVGESARQYAGRRYCDAACYQAGRWERSSGPERRCHWSSCRKRLQRRPDEAGYSFRTRKYCGRTCQYGAARDRERRAFRERARREPMRDGRTCGHCGADLVRHQGRRNDGRGQLEPMHSFRKRRFCGPPCQYAARRGVKLENPSAGNWPKKRTPIVRPEAPEWRPNVPITEIPAERLRGAADVQAGRSLMPWVGW